MPRAYVFSLDLYRAFGADGFRGVALLTLLRHLLVRKGEASDEWVVKALHPRLALETVGLGPKGLQAGLVALKAAGVFGVDEENGWLDFGCDPTMFQRRGQRDGSTGIMLAQHAWLTLPTVARIGARSSRQAAGRNVAVFTLLLTRANWTSGTATVTHRTLFDWLVRQESGPEFEALSKQIERSCQQLQAAGLLAFRQQWYQADEGDLRPGANTYQPRLILTREQAKQANVAWACDRADHRLRGALRSIPKRRRPAPKRPSQVSRESVSDVPHESLGCPAEGGSGVPLTEGIQTTLF